MGAIDGAQYALFVGPHAANWNNDQYVVAEQMKLNGADPKEILAKTGIWWGPDGKARMEIDDSAAKATGDTGTLGKALDHPELYKAYPDMRDIPATVEKPGMFDAPVSSGMYRLLNSGLPTRREAIEASGSDDDLRKMLLHESQHAIQEREGFEQGGLPGMPAPSAARDGASPDLYQKYLRVMGEAEARAAENREDLTAGQRRQIMPEQSYDVPINELTRKAQPYVAPNPEADARKEYETESKRLMNKDEQQ